MPAGKGTYGRKRGRPPVKGVKRRTKKGPKKMRSKKMGY